jgi:hypothetical protein
MNDGFCLFVSIWLSLLDPQQQQQQQSKGPS